jgi:WD40 repeat protein
MWDKRKPNDRVKTFSNHDDVVNKVEWCPQNSMLFSSASSDRKVNIWDISKIGKEQTAEEKMDGPPELLVGIE